MSNGPNQKPLPFAYQFLAGAIAGVTEITCMYPLDVVKTRFQLQVNTPTNNIILNSNNNIGSKIAQSTSGSARSFTTVNGSTIRGIASIGVNSPAAAAAAAAAATSASTSTAANIASNASLAAGGGTHYTSILDCLRKIVQQEGITTLYRGVLPPILAEAPKRAVKFGANEQWGMLLKKLFSIERFNLAQASFVGAMAGATEAFLVVPFDLIKIRLQDKGNAGLYRGTWDCVRKVAQQEGIFAFYNGLEATILRHSTWSGAYFGVIHGFRTAFPDRPGTTTKKEAMMKNFVAGAMGGTLGTMANTPFDVVKSRIQNQMKGNKKYGWTIPAIGTVYREEGFRALYKGFTPKVLRLGPGGGILLVVFDRVTEIMRKHLDG